MREVGVVVIDPGLKIILQIEGIVPFVDPDEVFFDPSDDAFGIGVALGIRPGREYLFDAGQRAIKPEPAAGRLAAVVRDQMQVMLQGVADASREAVINGHFQGIKPVICFRLDAQRVSEDFFGVPVKDNGQVKPAPGGQFDLCHVDAPKLIGAGRAGFPADVAASGLQAVVGLDRQIVFLHQALDAIFADFVMFAIV